MTSISKKELISLLSKLGAIQFGNFEVQRGVIAPFQVELSGLISEPQSAQMVCCALWEKAGKFKYDRLVGTPNFGALFASFISWKYTFPMVVRRLDGKEGIQILGRYKSGQKCLVLHDVLGLGGDLLSFIDTLEAEGLRATDTVALIDLEIGGKKRLKERGITPHSILGMRQVIEELFDIGRLAGDHHKRATDFFDGL